VNSAPTIATGRTIVDDVVAFVKRFVFLQRECMYRLVALRIIATCLHESFQYMGYLFIHSPEKECGKTRLLEILNLLVHNSTGIDCSPTAAVLSRTARGNTQLSNPLCKISWQIFIRPRRVCPAFHCDVPSRASKRSRRCSQVVHVETCCSTSRKGSPKTRDSFFIDAKSTSPRT
jgi:hypothetical protein